MRRCYDDRTGCRSITDCGPPQCDLAPKRSQQLPPTNHLICTPPFRPLLTANFAMTNFCPTPSQARIYLHVRTAQNLQSWHGVAEAQTAITFSEHRAWNGFLENGVAESISQQTSDVSFAIGLEKVPISPQIGGADGNINPLFATWSELAATQATETLNLPPTLFILSPFLTTPNFAFTT